MYQIILFAIAAGFEFLVEDRDNYLDWSLSLSLHQNKSITSSVNANKSITSSVNATKLV